MAVSAALFLLGLAGEDGAATPPAAPVNSGLPIISGIQTRGQTLSTTNGSWTGFPAPSYTYQWKRAGVDIGGETASTYLLAAADVGAAITVAVTATNASGSASATSAATGNIAAFLSISGTPVTTGATSVPYAGFSAAGAGGHTPYVYSIAGGALPAGLTLNASTGAVSGTPTVGGTQTGIVIRVTDADGLTADLAAFQIAVSTIPVNSVLPVVSGTTTVGQLLTTTDGTWSDAPTGYTYQWKRAGSSIGGATANTYTLVQADAGSTLTCEVVASNASGSSAAASSAATAEIMDAAAAAYFARRGTQPTTARKTLYNTLFRSLRTGAISGNNILAKMVMLQVFATDNSTDALLNLLSASFPATLISTPTFTADRGFDPDGAATAVNSGFDPVAAAGIFTQNDASAGVWSRKSGSNTSTVFGWSDGTDGTTINPRTTGDTFATRINQASAGGNANTDGSGFFAVSRTASNAWQNYKNGASHATGTNASVARNNSTFRYGNGATAAFIACQVCAGFAGQSLTANEHADLYNALRAYMTGVGVP